MPGKNIKKLLGKPLISYAIEAAKKSKYVDRVLVSTDDLKIAKIAKKYGAEVPFLRPVKFATDTAMASSVLRHAVSYFEKNENFKPDIVVLIQTVSPLVKPEDVDGTIKNIIVTKTNSCFSVSEISQRPEWMYKIRDGLARPFIVQKGEPKRSQDLSRLVITNGAVYAMKYDTLMKKNIIEDSNSASFYLMPKQRSVDIDELFDFELAEFLLKKQNLNEKNKNKNKKTKAYMARLPKNL